MFGWPPLGVSTGGGRYTYPTGYTYSLGYLAPGIPTTPPPQDTYPYWDTYPSGIATYRDTYLPPQGT